MRKHLSLYVLAACAALIALPAGAAVLKGAIWSATYVAAYEPTFGAQGIPYAGTMKIKVDHGIVSGTYTAESVRPDPLYGRIVNVTGTMSGGHVMLRFGPFSMQSGTIWTDGTISGTAQYNGKLYNFLAKVKSSP